MNPNRLQPGVDDATVSNLAPTLGSLDLAFYSLPQSHNAEWYRADSEFFASHPDRRIYLRPAFRGEMDIFTSEGDWQRRPTLWVCVSQLATGYHERTPRFRGKANWPEPLSDEDVAKILFQMSCREGERASEVQSYIFDERTRRADEALLRKRRNYRVN